MESAPLGGNLATASVLRGTLIALLSKKTLPFIIIMSLATAVSVAVRSVIMNAMEHAPQGEPLAMESVLRDIEIAEVSVAMKRVIMIAMESAPQSTLPVMESALKVYLSAMVDASPRGIWTRVTGTVMESAPPGLDPVMESVLGIMLSAMIIASLKILLTNTTITVEANALGRINHATGPASREQQSAGTTCASAVMMTLTVSTAATTSEIATAPVPQSIGLVTRPASQDTITATTPMAVTINTVMKDA